MVSQYIPNPVPQGDLESLKRFIGLELQRIARCSTEASERVSFQILYAAPTKYNAGDVVYADGTRWNPDGVSGQGLYRRNVLNTLWVFIG